MELNDAEDFITHSNVASRMSKSSSYFLEFKDDVNGQFERTNLGTPKKIGYAIGTCDGLLLLWDGYMQTYVVNPLLKCWLRIPPFPGSRKYSPLGCDCTITCVPHMAKFKLFHVNVLEVSGVVWYVCYVLRIGIYNSWKEIARKESPPNNDHLHWQKLCSGGNDVYWITKKGVIVMDVDREIILQEYPLHNFSSVASSYLVMGNRLCCILLDYINRAHQFEILYFDSEKWSLYYKMESIDFEAACGHELNIWSVRFRLLINDHIIIRCQTENSFTCIENVHFCYNVKTKQLTKIEDIDVGNFEVWLHTNSLVTLPSSPT
ncbi:unnamed protein product [Trifolium pratense]|uniref:Uncharacterized protein n=1 Tax=Trifolium pratense TaxID=57577 RepID=A0ACB0L3F3_TRIPR|nr:unnamed protein product [Trifolium pratense]